MSRSQKRPISESLCLPLGGIDTHAHLDLPEFQTDIQATLAKAHETGLSYIGNVFLGPQAYTENRTLFDLYPNVFFILGMHPHNAQAVDEACLARIQDALEHDERVKALGEIGLDYFRDHAPHKVQQKAFHAQLELAKDLERPVVIHSRAAEEDTFAVLDRVGYNHRPLLWHCFGGGPDLAAEILRRGWMISIPGTVTFSKAKDLHQAVQSIPLSRMVLETDCPFLTPEPYRGKRNEPALVAFTARKVAALREDDISQIWLQAGRNAQEFFGLG
jgi:TatD DNase family protein